MTHLSAFNLKSAVRLRIQRPGGRKRREEQTQGGARPVRLFGGTILRVGGLTVQVSDPSPFFTGELAGRNPLNLRRGGSQSGDWIFVSWRARIVVPDLLAAMGFAYPCPDSGQGDDSYHGWTGTRMVGIDPDPVVGQMPGPGPAQIFSSPAARSFPSPSLKESE